MTCLNPSPLDKKALKVSCPARKSTCPELPDGTFKEPCILISFLSNFSLPLPWETENMQMKIVLNSIKTMTYGISFWNILKWFIIYFSYQSFMTGNLYHHLHNLALLAVPFAKRPVLVRRNSLLFYKNKMSFKTIVTFTQTLFIGYVL